MPRTPRRFRKRTRHINISRNYAEPWVQPLYTHPDVEKTFRQVVQVPYGKDIDVTKTLRFRFIEAGHILGSAMVHLTAAAPGRDRTLSFSGDMGRRGLPILKATGEVPPADVLVCESTYGNRLHRSFAETVQKLYAAIHATVEKDGKVLIPAFSLGRTQLIIHVLQQALRQKKIPAIPIYVDSPLAAEVAEVYRAHPNSLSADIAEALREGHGLLGGDGVTYVRDFEESTRLATRPGPAIIAASACATRAAFSSTSSNCGRRAAPSRVSFRAGTVGRKLLESKLTVRFQRDWNKWIEVVHRRVQRPRGPRGLPGIPDAAGGEGRQGAVIHGEPRAGRGTAETLHDLGFDDRGARPATASCWGEP